MVDILGGTSLEIADFSFAKNVSVTDSIASLLGMGSHVHFPPSVLGPGLA